MSSMLLAIAAAALTPAQDAAPPADPAAAPSITATEALRNERAVTRSVTTAPRVKPCPEASSNEIVVCRRLEDPKTQYVPSDTDSGLPDDDGVPRAPDVSGLPSCAGATVCAQHLGAKPRQLYVIDLKAIPEPPAGSDADKIAKGEMAPP